MIHWVCKTCGRAIIAKNKPNFCYFDRTTSIENIGDEDAKKMGLFDFSKGFVLYQTGRCGDIEEKLIFEFIGDYQYDPYTGIAIEQLILGEKLTDFQDQIMQEVLVK